MRTLKSTEAEELLIDVVHDLRQPLGIIETGTFILNALLQGASPQVQEQLRIMERQVAIAAGILHDGAAALRRLQAQTEAERLEVTNSHTAAVT